MPVQQRDEATPPHRVDASMLLLKDIFDHPLEPGYAEAAARNRDGGQQTKGSRSKTLLLVAAGLAIGLLFMTAASEVRGSAEVFSAERSTLLSRIEDYNSYVDDLENRLTLLEQENVRLQANQLQGANASREMQASLARTQAITGTTAVAGPGVRIVIDNPSEDAATATDSGDVAKVLDLDLQRVVNGLWAAHAEAVSINGQRLTSLSAIRSANEVVLVNYRPLNPPYTILAIGDPDTLAAKFLEGSGGQWLRDTSSLFGIKFDVHAEDNLELPGRTIGTLRHVNLGDEQ